MSRETKGGTNAHTMGYRPALKRKRSLIVLQHGWVPRTSASHKHTNTVRFYLGEVPRGVRVIETENRGGLRRAGNGEMVFHGYRCSVIQDEKGSRAWLHNDVNALNTIKRVRLKGVKMVNFMLCIFAHY